MKRKGIHSILVAIDGSEYSDKAFEYACELSIMKNIPLIIINVVEEYATIGHYFERTKEVKQTNASRI